MKIICLLIALTFITGCAATKVITVPTKATAAVVGGTADLLD